MTAGSTLRRLIGATANEKLSDEEQAHFDATEDYVKKFEAAMDDDANTADAVSAVFELVKYINTNASSENSRVYLELLYARLNTLCDVLGIILEREEEVDADVEALIQERTEAKKAKNFARADEIREELKNRGIILEDTREGVKWKRI